MESRSILTMLRIQRALTLSTQPLIRSISIKPEKGGSGSDITVTGKGFTDGQATIFIDEPVADDDPETTNVDESMPPNNEFDSGEDTLGRADIEDGSFTFTTTKVKADSYINAFDTDDADIGQQEVHGDSTASRLAPRNFQLGRDADHLTMDWEHDRIRRVTFTGGHEVMIPADQLILVTMMLPKR